MRIGKPPNDTSSTLGESETDSSSVAASNSPVSVLPVMLKNSLANLGRLASSWLLVLIVPPLLARHLAVPTFATWMLILQLAAYVTVVQVGIEMPVSRYVARAHETGEEIHGGQILGAAVLLLVLFAFLLLTVTLIVSWNLHLLFPGIPDSLLFDAQSALLLVGMSLSVNLPFSIFSGLFQGHQKFEIPALASGVSKLSTALGVIWVALGGGGLTQMGVWAGFGPCLQSMILVMAWRRRGHKMKLVPSVPDINAVKEFFRFCSTMLLVQFTSVLISGLDLPIVAKFAFVSAGYYAAASTACSVFSVPYTAIVSTFLPVASGLVARKSPQEAGFALMRATRYSTALVCTMSFPFVLAMNPLLRAWIGSSYASHTVLLAETLVAAQFMRLTMFPYAIMGFSAGQQGRMLTSPLTEGVVNLICSLILVRLYGGFGVALGTLVGSVVGVVLHFTNSIPATDYISVDRLQLLLSGIVKPLFVSIPPLIAVGAVVFATKDLVVQIACVILGAILIALAQYQFTLNRNERVELREIVNRYSRKLGWSLQPV